jgi:predicted  nucleic acid-binding Zn-ribbon protein
VKWLSRLKKQSNSDMTARQSKNKTVRQIQNEIEKLRDEYKKTELRPCQGDTDLRQRENELDNLKSKIYELERERDDRIYTWQH